MDIKLPVNCEWKENHENHDYNLLFDILFSDGHLFCSPQTAFHLHKCHCKLNIVCAIDIVTRNQQKLQITREIHYDALNRHIVERK